MQLLVGWCNFWVGLFDERVVTMETVCCAGLMDVDRMDKRDSFNAMGIAALYMLLDEHTQVWKTSRVCVCVCVCVCVSVCLSVYLCLCMLLDKPSEQTAFG